MDFTVRTLSNGLRVIMNKNNNQPTATIGVIVNIGSNWETKQLNGISHFVEHLFFKGSTKYPNQRELSLELEKYGAISNAFTTREITCYHIKVNSDHLHPIIDILSEVLMNSLYRSKDIEMEKNVVINEIHQRRSNPSYLLNSEIYASFFEGLPIAKPVTGYPENIKQITRANIIGFINEYYKPENMIISVAGNFRSYNSLCDILENRFSKVNVNVMSSIKKTKSKTMTSLEKYHNEWSNVLKLVKNITSVKFKQINHHVEPVSAQEHTFVSIVFEGLKYNNMEKYKYDFISNILGKGMSSRLFDTIRNKHGLVYNISSSHNSSDYTGIFTITYSCNHDKNIQIKILKLIRDEINIMITEKISQLEYKTCLGKMENSIKMSQESSYDNCIYYGTQLLKNEGKIMSYKQMVGEYKKISIDDLLDYSKQLFDLSHFLVVTLSPTKIKEEVYQKIFRTSK
jgi:predicted Zn-dependent peptidase